LNIIGKEKIRRKIAEQRNNLSAEFIEKNSKVISEKLLGMDIYNEADTVYMYMDYRGEVATKEIIEDAFAKGKKVALPRIVDDKMEFYYITDIDDTNVGYFGIKEPVSNEIARGENPLVIMPGVAFDSNKHRIGYGRGFYDKYLAENNGYNKVALSFDFQVMEEVPFDNTDITPDIIITEKNIVY